MTYGVKYQFSIEATNGDEVDIFLLQRDYSGQKHIRALGRAPILKRERNGCILGTSLEIFAECRVDGEFAELYTSDAYEYKVEVYKRQILQWTGFVSPELYAEPDIAPPYDVQIIATDGLGELKNYDFAAYDRLKSYQAYIELMLEHTGLGLAVEVVSDLQYYDEGWSDANGLESIVVDLSHKAGENCYDILQAMLTSVNACITQQDGSWTVIRESDLYSWRNTIGSMEFGSMNSCDWWPVGNLNADVIPAKKYLSLTSENHYKPTVLQNSAMASDEGWAKEYNAAYDETEKAYILPDGGSNIRQTVNFFTEVGYRLFLHISARNVGDAAESQKLGVMIKINGRMYQAGDEFWLKELAGYEGRYAWSNTEGYLEFELPEPSDSETRADASDIEVVIPLYKYDSRSYAYATSLEVMIFNISGVHDIYLYECSLQQYEQPLGHKIEAVIANGARESMSDIELALNDGTYAQPAAEIFRNAIPIAYHSEAIIQKWKTPASGEGSYLSVMAKDYAMQVALPRMRYRGKLNVPSMAEPVVPLLFFRDGTYYFLNTYSYDLLNDELEVELISIPNANVAIESETITEIVSPGSASGTGVGGSGVAGGGNEPNLAGYATEEWVKEQGYAEARIIHVNMSSANEQIAEQKAYNAETYKKIVAGEKLYLLYPADAGYWMLTPITNINGVISLERSTTDGYGAYVTTVQLSEDGTTTVSMEMRTFPTYQIDSEMSDISGGLVPNKIIKKYVDDAVANAGAGAVIFDATCSTDPWSLNVLQTETTVEEITNAINNGSPIYMRFGSGLVAVDNAELYKNGDVSLYVHLVDSESELIRTIHAYSTTDGGWEWESFDNPMGGIPDEEDITTNAEGKLQFKDRVAVDGMGYIILRKEKSLAEQMTQTDTIYEIRYDFDLQGSTLTLPENCVLKFVGGRIANGTLRGTNTKIDADAVEIFSNITFTRSWLVDAIYAEWWGARGYFSRATYTSEGGKPQQLNIPEAVDSLADSSAAINAALAFSSHTGGEVRLQGLIYRINDTIVMDRYSALKMQSETMIVPYITGAGNRIVTHNVTNASMTFTDLSSPAETLARNELIDTSAMGIAIKVNPVRTKLYGGGSISLLKSRYTIGVCVTSEDWHYMDMTYMSPVIDIVTVGDRRQVYAPDPRDIIGSGAPTDSVGEGNTETIFYWDRSGKKYYRRTAGGSWSEVSSNADPLWNTSLRFDVGTTSFARLINPQITLKDIFGARGIEVFVRVPDGAAEMPWFNQSIVKGSISEKYSHYVGIFVDYRCSFDIHDWYDIVFQCGPVNMYDSSVVYAIKSGNVKFGMIWDLAWLGTRAETSFYLGSQTSGMSFMTLSGGTIVDLGNKNSYPGKDEGSENTGVIPRIEMTEDVASIKPNAFYVWGVMPSLNVSFADGEQGVMNRYLFQFRNPKDSTTALTLPASIVWEEGVTLDENGKPILAPMGLNRIEVIENLATIKKWVIAYITFADEKVESLLLANGVGDGYGITKYDASQADVNALINGEDGVEVFAGNTEITSFDELQYFTGLTHLSHVNSTTGRTAFAGCTSLQRVTLPSSCDRLENGSISNQGGSGAFWGCTALEYVGNTQHVNFIGAASFYNCSSLKEAIFPNATEIGDDAFRGCAELEQIDISKATEYIGGYAFYGCNVVQSIAMPSDIRYIGYAAFAGVSAPFELNAPSLTEMESHYNYNPGAFANSGLTYIRSLGNITVIPGGAGDQTMYGAFGGCVNLIGAVLPETLVNIGRTAFKECTSLVTANLPDALEVINSCVFEGCSAFSIDVTGTMQNVKYLGYAAFANTKVTGYLSLPALETLQSGNYTNGQFRDSAIIKILDLGKCTQIPSGSTWYGGVFSNCKSLISVRLHAGMTSIGNYAFYGCTAIEEVICEAVNPPTLSANAFEAASSSFYIYVPDDSVEAYKTADVWSGFALKIKPMSQYGVKVEVVEYDRLIGDGVAFITLPIVYKAGWSYKWTLDYLEASTDNNTKGMYASGGIEIYHSTYKELRISGVASSYLWGSFKGLQTLEFTPGGILRNGASFKTDAITTDKTTNIVFYGQSYIHHRSLEVKDADGNLVHQWIPCTGDGLPALYDKITEEVVFFNQTGSYSVENDE